MAKKLDFRSVLRHEEKWPWDLGIFLYRFSGRSSKYKRMQDIAAGKYGQPRRKRLPLLKQIHAALETDVAGGGSVETLETKIRALLPFFAFCDAKNVDPTLDQAELLKIYSRWMVYEKKKRFDTNGKTLYYLASNVAKVLGVASGLKPRDFTVQSGVAEPLRQKSALTPIHDKQQISDELIFAKHILDIIASLSPATLSGPMPMVIDFHTGKRFLHHCRKWPPKRLREHRKAIGAPPEKRGVQFRWRRTDDETNRNPAINLRIEAELLLFIAQTGINLAQAMRYDVSDFRYSSHLDGYKVMRRYKARRHGEVEFEIYSEYRPHFDNYLRWRRQIVIDKEDRRLFPFLRKKGSRPDPRGNFDRVRKVLRAVGAPFVGPARLRGLRVNWLLRRTHDPALVADLAQHSVQILETIYRRPDHATAAHQLTHFWCQTDPSLLPPAPGKCVEQSPTMEAEPPPTAPEPDCVAVSGCLFCIHHRDLASFDYVWSLLSYRHLKSLELAQQSMTLNQSLPTPAQAVVERITKKIQALSELNEQFQEWVSEAKLRIREENYHPDWSVLIDLAPI